MNNHILPAHEFFIFVPTRSDGQQSSSVTSIEKHNECSAQDIQKSANVPVSLHSWTKIVVADTLDVYACLQEDEHYASPSR
ncbi:hypothetical protein [Dictyobacter formicarum]|uniref:Uncharacterized protein n=1 Tax=Dictyobacter formicarum TaxID=2778368 RepID=A0ABQ3VBQ4_9CHLR|nr:hypothetical protein [Dictyobacter formicarum]GHO83395.1 hypothetical protein KSZ_14010 [Dictyobacter formicarum]